MADLKNYYNSADKEIIAKNEKWFKIWLFLPIICAGFLALAGFITSWIFIFDEIGIGVFILLIVTPFVVASSYCVCKFLVSEKILKIYYLKGIYEQGKKEKNELKEETIDTEELPTI